jgi:hypothetical protein
MAGTPVLFRTYPVPKNETFNCTIWEAARATSAAPTIFKNIEIGGPGTRQKYIDGAVGFNNPTEHVLLEAESVFPGRPVACLISIGTGYKVNSIPKHVWWQRFVPVGVIRAMVTIATDCESTSQTITRRFKDTPGVYFRFNVEQGLQDIALEHWDQLAKVTAHTLQYLKYKEVDEKIGAAVDAIREQGRTTKISM